MKKSLLAVLLLGQLLCGQSFARSGPPSPQGGAGHAAQAPCAILKRMGPADEVTSHLYSFGIRGKQFQYVEGDLPQGVNFHGRLTDHDVRKIENAGGKVVIVESHYTDAELQHARGSCGENAPAASGESGKTASPSAAPASPAASPDSAVAATATVAVTVKSTPDGADISVDGKFVGNTPSTLKLAPGDHTIAVESSGFKSWQRTMTLSAGSDVTVSATLEKAQ
jgi:hypothetical protein